jgi:tetratricopeptide (TPR) repeat protein
MMGQPDAAKVAFVQALRGPADFTGKEEAQRRLALLEAGAGQQTVSREALEKLLAEQPADIIGWMRLAEIYEAEKDLPKAAQAYEKARQLNPNLLAANLKLAQFNAGFLQNEKKAIEFAKKSRELAPNDLAVTGTLGEIVLQAGNYQWAYSLLQEAGHEKDPPASVLHSLAWAAYSLGKVPEARQTMQRTSAAAAPGSVEKKDAETFLALTTIEEDPSQIGPLEPRIKNTLDAQPDYLPALMGRAALQMQRNDLAQAMTIYAEILRRYPDFAPAQRELAAAYSQTSDSLGKAVELATKARKSLADDARLARILAEISFKRKEFGYAAQLFQESARKLPLDANALYQLGVAELETKKKADGLDHLHRALAAGLKGDVAADARRRITEAEAK